MENYDIRAEARQLLTTLKGKYLLFAIPILVQFLNIVVQIHHEFGNLTYQATGFLDTTRTGTILAGFVFSIVMAILSAFITVGVSWTILTVIRTKKTEVTFKESLIALSEPYIFKTFVSLFMRGLFLYLWEMLGLLIAVIAGIAILIPSMSDSMSSESINPVATAIFTMLFVAVLALIPYFIKSFSYAMTEYLIFDSIEEGTYSGATHAVTESRKLMKGYKWQLFWFEFSFLGWWILTGLTFGLAGIYVVPYYMTARALFYNKLRTLKQTTPENSIV